MDEAYRQLGYPKPVPAPPSNSIGVLVNSTGWKNVDAYVAESVTKRETLDYTDKDGNRAVIKYEPIRLQIADQSSYDRVLVYLLPKELFSFQRMKDNGNGFEEKLNELFEYEILCVGYKDNNTFSHHIEKGEPKEYGVLSLAPISESALENLLSKTGRNSVTANLKRDLKYQKFEIEETKRQEKLMALSKLRREMYYVVFPCSPQLFFSDMEAMVGE